MQSRSFSQQVRVYVVTVGGGVRRGVGFCMGCGASVVGSMSNNKGTPMNDRVEKDRVGLYGI